MDGLDKFREAFAEYSENYVVIGGTACDITMTNTVVRPRATHDIDMIVIVENMTEDFANRFWQFVREAGYRPEKRKQEAGEPARYEMYRFLDGKDGYPEMIELLKNVVIMTEDTVRAPASIVACIQEFVASIRTDWTALAEPLSKSLDRDGDFVNGLLGQLDEMFIEE